VTKASDNAFPSLLITEGTEPSAPAAGKQRLYIDSTTHKLKRTDSSGTDVTIEGTANALSITTVRRTTSQNVSGSGTETAISFDTETEDTDGAWAIGTPTKIIIPSALNGRRAIFYGMGAFSANTGGNYRHLRIGTGAGAALTPDAVCIMPDMATNATNIVVQVFSTPRTLNTSDEYTLMMRIDTTGIGIDFGWFGFYTID